MAVKCIFCGGPADPRWETCSACDIEQQQVDEYEDQYAREFAEREYLEQEEIKYLDDVLFGGH